MPFAFGLQDSIALLVRLVLPAIQQLGILALLCLIYLLDYQPLEQDFEFQMTARQASEGVPGRAYAFQTRMKFKVTNSLIPLWTVSLELGSVSNYVVSTRMKLIVRVLQHGVGQVGCPSSKVVNKKEESECFGARLMLDPPLVGVCVVALHRIVEQRDGFKVLNVLSLQDPVKVRKIPLDTSKCSYPHLFAMYELWKFQWSEYRALAQVSYPVYWANATSSKQGRKFCHGCFRLQTEEKSSQYSI